MMAAAVKAMAEPKTTFEPEPHWPFAVRIEVPQVLYGVGCPDSGPWGGSTLIPYIYGMKADRLESP
jgi:hypothetical protein